MKRLARLATVDFKRYRNMKDKIYFSPESLDFGFGRNKETDVEYICKDSLLKMIDEAIGTVEDYIEKTPYLAPSQRPIEVRGKLEAFNEIRALIKEM